MANSQLSVVQPNKFGFRSYRIPPNGSFTAQGLWSIRVSHSGLTPRALFWRRFAAIEIDSRQGLALRAAEGMPALLRQQHTQIASRHFLRLWDPQHAQHRGGNIA